VVAHGSSTTRDELRQILAGTAALIAILALFFFSYRANRESARIPAAGYRIDALFNRVTGIGPGSPVEVAGIPVGAVEAMSLQPDYRARVTMRINSGVLLPRDTSAAIHTDGLFGGRFLVLDPGGEDVLLGDGATVAYTQDAVVISDLLDLIIAEGRAARAASPDRGS
jgi:phospholipid/cholesterol/gamma-HCH transport system substrate-binding protein